MKFRSLIAAAMVVVASPALSAEYTKCWDGYICKDGTGYFNRVFPLGIIEVPTTATPSPVSPYDFNTLLDFYADVETDLPVADEASTYGFEWVTDFDPGQITGKTQAEITTLVNQYIDGLDAGGAQRPLAYIVADEGLSVHGTTVQELQWTRDAIRAKDANALTFYVDYPEESFVAARDTYDYAVWNVYPVGENSNLNMTDYRAGIQSIAASAAPKHFGIALQAYTNTPGWQSVTAGEAEAMAGIAITNGAKFLYAYTYAPYGNNYGMVDHPTTFSIYKNLFNKLNSSGIYNALRGQVSQTATASTTSSGISWILKYDANTNKQVLIAVNRSHAATHVNYHYAGLNNDNVTFTLGGSIPANALAVQLMGGTTNQQLVNGQFTTSFAPYQMKVWRFQ